MRERDSRRPVATRFFAAAQTAPPSGQTKRPSAAPISSAARRISLSVTETASPCEARMSRRIRKSAKAFHMPISPVPPPVGSERAAKRRENLSERRGLRHVSGRRRLGHVSPDLASDPSPTAIPDKKQRLPAQGVGDPISPISQSQILAMT